MAKAIRSKADFPDTVYFDDQFTTVALDDLIGKTIYIEPFFTPGLDYAEDRAKFKELKKLGVTIMTKNKFNASDCDYIVISSGYTKTRKAGINKEQKAAMKCWKETGSPMRVSLDNILKLV